MELSTTQMQNQGEAENRHWSRRAWIRAAGLGSLTGGVALASRGAAGGQAGPEGSGPDHLGNAMGPVGRVSTESFDPMAFLRAWNFSDLPADERARFYRETPRQDGTLLREYELFAVDREIEIAPGVFFPAWTYNGQVPGPFGVHLYHCHANPLKRHVHKGLYGAFIVDPPAETPRPPADELVMVLNAFDTNFDAENEVYAVNTAASFYMHEPVTVRVGERVRMYVVNLTEFDLINSFHLHAMFFDVSRTGTTLVPTETTDTIMLCQGERAILETTFRYPGDFMFHAHQSEFAELGWMGLFRAEERAHSD